MATLGFYLYLLFTVSWFTHLTSRLGFLGVIRFDLLLIAAISVCAAMQPRRPHASKVGGLLLALAAYVTVTLPFVEWPGSVVGSGLEMLAKAVVFYFFTVALVTTEYRLRTLVAVFAACQIFRVLEPLYLNQTQGYWGSRASMAGWEFMQRLSGAPHDVINPNGLAFVALTSICFAHFIWTAKPAGRAIYAFVLPMVLYTLVLTGSRSGIVGLVAMFLAMMSKSRHKMALAALACVVVLLSAPRLGDDLSDRYLSLFSSSARNAGTAEGRVEGLQENLRVAMRRPLFGHGLGTSREANANFSGSDQPAHNLYAEVAQELGFVGLVLFVCIIYTTGTNLYWACRQVRAQGESGRYLLSLTDALQVWLAMNLVFSLASYGLTSYEWYLMAGLSEALRGLATARGTAETPAPALAVTTHPMLAGVRDARIA